MTPPTRDSRHDFVSRTEQGQYARKVAASRRPSRDSRCSGWSNPTSERDWHGSAIRVAGAGQEPADLPHRRVIPGRGHWGDRNRLQHSGRFVPAPVGLSQAPRGRPDRGWRFFVSRVQGVSTAMSRAERGVGRNRAWRGVAGWGTVAFCAREHGEPEFFQCAGVARRTGDIIRRAGGGRERAGGGDQSFVVAPIFWRRHERGGADDSIGRHAAGGGGSGSQGVPWGGTLFFARPLVSG